MANRVRLPALPPRAGRLRPGQRRGRTALYRRPPARTTGTRRGGAPPGRARPSADPPAARALRRRETAHRDRARGRGRARAAARRRADRLAGQPVGRGRRAAAARAQQDRRDRGRDHPRADRRLAPAAPGRHPGRPGGRRPDGGGGVTTALRPGRLGPPDVLRLAAHGLRARPLRVVLSALGIAIGIAAMVAVVGASTSSRAQLNSLLSSLGTNLLTVAPGSTLFGQQATLPDESVAMIGRIGRVESVTAIGQLADAKVYRTNKVPAPLAPELDLGALIGWPAGRRYLGIDGDITTVYTRTDPDAVAAVRDLLARTANPASPNEVDVSRPSDALAAQAAVDKTFTGLLLGLGAVALLVGGIGVANTMVISVLERRAEIGLRRS